MRRFRGSADRRIVAILGVAALALGLAACGEESTGSQPSGGATEESSGPGKGEAGAIDVGETGDNPIVIGVVHGISGPNSTFSDSVRQSVQLAVEEINDQGGVLGRKIKLVEGDDGTDARIARQAWDSVINQQNADAVVALETSAARNAGLPVAEAANVPAIYTSLYEGKACSPVLYVDAEVPNQQIDPEVEYLTKERDAKSFFLVGSDYIWPRETFKVAKRLIDEAGGEVKGEQYAPIGTTDWASVVSKIRAADPDVVWFALAGGSDNVSLMKQLRASGSEAIVVSPDIDESVLEALGEDGEGLIMAGAYFQTIDTPGNKKFLDALKERFGDDVKAQNIYSTPTYDAVHLFARAFEEAGSTKPEAVLEALSKVSFTGPRGEVSMTTDRHSTLPIYLAEGRDDGSFKIIKELGEVPAADQCEPDPPFGGN